MSREQNGDNPRKIKLIALGSSGVGKSCILTRFAHDKFDQFSQSTLGAAFIPKKFVLKDGTHIEFHLWDTAGQEKYKSIAPIYYRQAKVALCVYDITSQASFDSMKTWIDQLKLNGPSDILIWVVGNKTDRVADQQVCYNDAKQYSAKMSAGFSLVSAKQNKNIHELFTQVANKVINGNKKNNTNKNGQALGSNNAKPKSGCC